MDKMKALGRRDFLIALGAGTSLAIAGFFTFHSLGEGSDAPPEEQAGIPVENPKLSDDVKRTFEDDRLVLTGEHAKCIVNRTGEKIIELLDGKHTLPRITARIADFYAIEYTDALQVSVASFICQLGAQGFLSSPFYVTMYENY